MMNFTAIFDALKSHSSSSGLFESVNGHEPKSKPGTGLSTSIFADRVRPYAAHSGLAATSAQIVFTQRVYLSAFGEPADEIDPAILNAVDVLMTAYSGDFTLGTTVSSIDLLGQAGQTLEARAGYLDIDKTIFRHMTLIIPVIVEDAWTQSP